MKGNKRPHVICHMMSTVDGRIISANWGSAQKAKAFGKIYERCHDTFKSEAWLVGRVTMEKHFAKGKQSKLERPRKPIKRRAFIGNPAATSFAIAVDPKGKLRWTNNEISGDHVIELLTENVTDAYLHNLQKKGISYVFAGKDELDLRSALKQLAKLFPIQTIMLEGGGNINGSFLNEGLIDELSLLLVPIADGTPGTPTTFEIGKRLQKKSSRLLRLSVVKELEDGVVWLNYKLS